MQNGSWARRLRVQFSDYTKNNGELPGLVRFGEINLESHVIDVPTFHRIIKIQSGIITMPEVQLSFNTERESDTRAYLRNWWKNKNQVDLTITPVDATEEDVMDRVLWLSCEIRRLSEPEMDLMNPTYARMDITILPFDIVPIDI